MRILQHNILSALVNKKLVKSYGIFTSSGWDFVGETENGTEDIWWILEGRDYPRLTWELVEGGSTALAENWLTGIDN